MPSSPYANKHFRPQPAPPYDGPDSHRPISPSLAENIDFLRALFVSPPNADLVVRPIKIAGVDAALVYVEGMSSQQMISISILRPLTQIDAERGRPTMAALREACLATSDVKTVATVFEAVTDMLNGRSALFLDGSSSALLCETIGYDKRAIGPPMTEDVILGPQEGLTENLRTNVTLIRRIIRSPQLICEMLPLGEETPTTCAMLYRMDIANPSIVEEARRRLHAIDMPFVQSVGMLSQLFEDHPYSLFPQHVFTERPDRCASFLMEGQIVLLLDGSPFGVAAPCTYAHIFHSSDGNFMRWSTGTFTRVLRASGQIMSVFLPSLYLALTYYHHDMLPTELLISIADTHSNVPFPMIAEVLLLEFAFDLVREAGTRVPGIIGPSLSIIGALILGQAAVAANLVSPVLIIVIAMTGLGSFCISDYNTGIAMRLLRFVFILGAMLCGFFGISIVAFVTILLVSSKSSLGVPFTSPVAPHQGSNPDLLVRYPPWRSRNLRPAFMRARPRKGGKA